VNEIDTHKTDAVGQHGGAPIGPIRVIVADDAETLRSLMVRALERDGRLQVVAEVGDGNAAQQAVRNVPADVLLLDLSMPEVSGLDIIDQVASCLAVVVFTGYGDPELRRRCLTLGAAGFVTKGTSIPSIVETLVDAARSTSGRGDGTVDGGDARW